ncbi:hypothetical protein ACFVAE_11115 [Microbacterium sp. NPDC057659]|uniref:hypothetical protein n=1 Tax=Microbacterium sp. NPDC057659 TaxID=3346198 RepID=UPI003671C260
MARRRLHVMAEWGDTFPVWERTPGMNVGGIDPAESGLSEQLVQDLIAWNAQWEILFAAEPPGTEEEQRVWMRAGRGLAKRVGLEIGGDVMVTYQP